MSRMLRKQRRKSGSEIPEITLTPLIDTALTLLVIFMVTSPLINNGIKIDLPKGNVQEVQGIQEDLVVHLDKQGHVFINGMSVKREQLTGQLKNQMAHHHNKTVFVKGDGKVEYQEIITLVEEIKTVGGIDRVALATTKMG